MASLSVQPKNAGGHYAITVTVNFTESSVDNNANTSNVYFEVILSKNQWATNWYSMGTKIGVNVTCNGQTQTVYCPTYNYNGKNKPGTVFGSGTFTGIAHNADGTKSVGIGISAFDNTGASYGMGSASTSGTMGLTTIPRDFSSAPSLSFVSKTETTITYKWTTSETCDHISWSGGGTAGNVTGLPGKSGNVTFSGLSANSSYTHSGSFRRQDSQRSLTGTAGSQTTYDWPKPTSISNSKIGSTFTIAVSNPLGRTYTLKLFSKERASGQTSDVQLGSYTGNINGNVTGFSDSTTVDNMYKEIPAKTKGTYYAVVTYSGNNKQSADGTYEINNSDAEKPTFDTSYIIDVLNSAHTDISGTNKFIKGYNNLSAVIKPMVCNKHATPDKYIISALGLSSQTKTHTGSNISVTIGNMTSNKFSVTAYDKRGLSRTVEISINLVDYTQPNIASGYNGKPILSRLDGVGTKASVNILGSYTYWTNLLINNSITEIKYQYKKSTESSYSALKSLPSDAILTNNTNGTWSLVVVLADTFSNTDTYNIKFYIADKLSNITTTSYDLSTADALIWRDLVNKRVGIKKKPTCPLDVNGAGNFDGDLSNSGNVNFKKYNCSVNGSNTNNYPWRRIGYKNVGTGQYVDSDVILDIRGNYNGGGYGRIKISHRTNNTNAACNVSLKWIYRVGLPIDCVYIGYWGNTGQNTYFDIYYKSPGAWPRTTIHAIPGQRCDCILVSSNEVSDTTTSDKKSSTECYTSVADGGTKIRGQAYTGTAYPSDQNALNIMPVGYIYISGVNTSPAKLFGGQWTQIKSRFLYATGNAENSGAAVGITGQSSLTGTNVEAIKLSAAQSGVPAHSHSASSDGAGSHHHQLGYFTSCVASGSKYGRPVDRDQTSGRGYTSTDDGWHNHTIRVNNNTEANASATHTHAVANFSAYVWQRTN